MIGSYRIEGGRNRGQEKERRRKRKRKRKRRRKNKVALNQGVCWWA
jgi:hypothetical protein